jgi:hypothetical protein
MQYYKSYYLKKYNKVDIDFIEQMKFGYRVFYTDKLNCKVGEILDSKMNVTKVIYYTNIEIENIMQFHKSNYNQDVYISIAEELSNGIKIVHYDNASITLYQIETYYEDGKPKLRQEFNKDFELVEYCQSIYNADGVLTHEKYFYADSWTIHTEKMII